jgi:hypothetical protein
MRTRRANKNISRSLTQTEHENRAQRPRYLQTGKPDPVGDGKKLLSGGFSGWKPVALAAAVTNVPTVNLRHLKTKFFRLNLTKADREVAALKAQFRREDLALASDGRHDEIALRNRRLMGLKDGDRARLVGFGGVRFE